jgi:Leucine-rich repeat (LRR) protein
VLITILAICLVVKVHQANRKKIAVAWLRELGASVTYDYEVEQISNVPLTLRAASSACYSQLPVTERAGVDRNNRDVGFIGVTPTTAKGICDRLRIDYLTRVVQVDLASVKVPPTDLSPLLNLPNLEELYSCDVADIAPLAHLTRLRAVGLSSSSLTDLSPLANLAALEFLDLSGTQVSDLSQLANLTDLRFLFLSGTPVSDLSPLAGLSNLELLDLSETRVTDEEIRTLRKALPNCEIDR